MIDGHVHLENGDLSVHYVHEFINLAVSKGLDQLQILDHTHRFFEFKECYEAVCNASILQKKWFERKQKNHIDEYLKLIDTIKKEELPINVTFGLEVCFTPETETLLHDILSRYHFDFLVGSVHSVMNGKLYDMDAWSKELLWNKYPASDIYHAYYDSLTKAICSDLFTQIGHPDVIKMYMIDPGYDLIPTYKNLAKLAKLHHVKMEDNTGAHYRYHHPDVGLNDEFRKILKKEQVEIITASDAHYPEHVASCFELLKS